MIKLTRGALTMLLAQYRGILKNAWIKNFAVAAALATTVTSAYAAENVTTWDNAVKEGALALDGSAGVLNIQTSAKWKENPGTITITGGVDHKIGGEDGKNVSIFAEKENSEKPPVGSIVINTAGENASNAKLTIANKQSDTKTKTGVRIYSAEVKASSEEGKPKANLTVSTMPNIGPDYKDDEEQYVNIEKLTVDGKNASVNVTNGELDVNNQLTITNGANVEVNGVLWMGNCGHGDVTSVNVEDGTLTSAGIIVLDSTKLKVGDKGHVNVENQLNLADANEVNINKDLEARKITLTGGTHVTANKLVLDAKDKNEKVTEVTAKELTLGSDKYDNSGIGAEATVSKKLTALTKDIDGKKVAYKINTGESIKLNTEAVFIGLDDIISNEGNGTVASDLEVAGGNLNVQAGEWTAKNITVSAGALNVNGKSLAADGLTVKDGTATVEGNATLALKTLDIANGKTLTVAAGDAENNAGVLDLTNTTLVNATGKEASAIKGTIANAGVVKITGEKLQGAIANVTGAEEKNNLGYIFDNTGVIEVAGPTTLATDDFLASAGDTSGIVNTSGTLAVNGALTVNGDDKAAAELNNAGNIKAASLQLNGKKGGGETPDDASKFTLADGEYDIAGAVGANTDTLVVAGKVAAQSIGARILEITGQVGADESLAIGTVKTAVGSINATDILKTSTNAKVFADSITAGSINFNGQVTAGKVSSTNGLTVTAGDITVTGALNAAKLTQVAGILKVTKGSLTATEASVVGVALNNATANIGTLTAKTANSLTLDKSTATVGSFGGSEAAKDTVTIGKGSTLTITANQTAATEKDSAFFKNNENGDAITGIEGTLAVNAGALGLKQNEAKDNYEATNKFAKDTIGVLKINGAKDAIGAEKINKTNLGLLINAVSKDPGEAFNGKLQLVGVTADISDINVNNDGNATDGSLNYGDVKVFAQLAGDTTLESVTVNAGDGTIAVSGDVGNLVANASAGKVSIAEATLQGSGSSEKTNGYYVSQLKGDAGEDAKTVVLAGAELADANSSLTLAGAGKIGAVTAKNVGKGALNVTGNAAVVKVEAGKEVATDIGVSGAELAKVNVSGALTANDIFTKALESSGSVTAANISAVTAEVTGGEVKVGKITTSSTATINAGSVNVGEAEFTGALTMEGGALTATVDGGATGLVTLKADSEIKAGSITAKDLVAEKKLTSAGNITADTLTAQSTVDLTGGVVNAKEVSLADTTTINGNASLIADKVTGDGDITVGKDGVPNGTGSIYANKLTSTGKIFIDPDFGQQAAFVGAEHLQTNADTGFEETTGDIIVGKNAALAVGVSSVDQARSVLSSLGLTDANGSFKQNGVKNAIYTDALVKLGTGKGLTVDSNANPATAATAGVITLGDKSAVVIGKNAAAQSVKDRKAVLTADIAGAGVVAAGKSTVIFAGNATKQDIKDVKIFGNANGAGTVISAADAAKVSVQLSPLYNEAKLTVDGGITDITVNRGYINTALYNASLPVKNLVAEVADTALTGDGVGSDFIMENALVDGGANIESAARLATFGGAYQAAAAAVNTGIDAAQARLGLGIDNSAEVKGEDISVWANAVYKNTESDSFEAQGANYGADLDLTSLVIGADYNMAEGSKVGAYATFGTGDVDGKGAGHNVKNDVDTYGFGIYGSAKLASGVSILSDVGYTVAQNEFKGIVNADADMKVFTAGANVKYTFNTQVADISPFVGARYTSFNLESYAVKSAKGIVAYTDADTAHIFSIPVGFDLSKQITAGEWNVKPAFTAKVTFNTGDKTVSSSTQFTGVKNTLNLDAEVMDDVTYSVGASVSATKGAATFGAGLSYTGSSETNELSAQIGARYTF